MKSEPPIQLVLSRLDSGLDTREKCYLGAWALPELDSNALTTKKFIPYPYDVPGSYLASYQKLQASYLRLFPQFAAYLNQIHERNYSTRYWEIIAGYWFREFMEVLFERYLCLHHANLSNPDFEVFILNANTAITPLDSLHFNDLYKEEGYNYVLYSQIINYFKWFSITINPEVPSFSFPASKNNLRSIVEKLSLTLSKYNKHFFVTTYFPIKELLKIALALKDFPVVDIPKVRLSQKQNDIIKRQCFLKIQTQDAFEGLFVNMLQMHVPQVYVENLCLLEEYVKEKYPKKPKLIATGNSFSVNEAFKVWSAQQVELRSIPYVILQHGGNYGVGEVNSSEDYETRTADYFVTYGWNSPKKENLIPFFLNRIKQSKRRVQSQSNEKAHILWILASLPRYSYTMYSVPSGPQFIEYLNQQVEFLNALSPSLREEIICRPYKIPYGWDDLKWIREKSFDFKVTPAGSSIYHYLNTCKLNVCTYNATSHLETFSLGIPTVLYWKSEHWALREEAQAAHQALIDAGVLHFSPLSAARFVNERYAHIEEWWSDKKVQLAVNQFTEQYARVSNQFSKDWVGLFKKLSSNHGARGSVPIG